MTNDDFYQAVKSIQPNALYTYLARWVRYNQFPNLNAVNNHGMQVSEISQGVSYLHAQEIIHGDLRGVCALHCIILISHSFNSSRTSWLTNNSVSNYRILDLRNSRMMTAQASWAHLLGILGGLHQSCFDLKMSLRALTLAQTYIHLVACVLR